MGHSWLARMFFGDVPLLVADLFRNSPEGWTDPGERNPFSKGVYKVRHDPSGLQVWVANGAAGVDVSHRGRKIFGCVTMLSTFGLSPGHWLIWNAYRRWALNDVIGALR